MRWKWILSILGLLVVAFIVIAYVVVVTYDFNKLKPRISRAVYDATGRELTMGGDFKASIGFSPTVSVEKVELQNAPWGSRPAMARLKRLEIQVALLPLIRREIQFKRLILVEPDILIETDASGRSNLEFKPVEKPRPEEKKGESRLELLPLIFEEVRLEKGVLTYRDGKKGKSSSLAIERFKASLPGGEKLNDFTFQGAFNGQPLEVQGTTGSLAGLAVPGKPWPLKVSAKAAGAVAAVEGSIADLRKAKGLDLSVNAEGPSMGKLAGLGGVTDLPDPGPFKISAKVAGSAEHLKVSSLRANLGSSDLAGSLELNASGKPPRIAADLTSQKLDLGPFLAAGGTKAPGPQKPAGKKEKIFPAGPLRLEGLKAFDGRVKLKAGQLQAAGFTLNDLNTEVTLESGNLSAQPLGFHLAGGAVNGSVQLRSQEKSSAFNLNFKIDRLDVGSLLKELESKQALEGKLDSEIELTGQGRSVAEWMAGLNGRTLAVMGKGRLDNKYLDLLGGDMAKNILRLLNPSQKPEEFTRVNCFVSGFRVRNGIAECTALLLDTNQMSVAGAGEVNLKNETLNLGLKPSPKEGSGLGKVGISLGELAKPLKLGGTLAKPSLAIDPQAALSILGKAAGGAALFGPAGILAGLATTTPEDKNPCLTAIESARKPGKAVKKSEERKAAPGVSKESIEGVGRELKKLFGK